MELVISGDLYDEDGVHQDVELWRRPFLGWGDRHVLLAERRCRPRRYEVIDMGVVKGSGLTDDALIEAGGFFALTP